MNKDKIKSSSQQEKLMEDANETLRTLCALDTTGEKIRLFLDKYPDIDLSYDESIFFRLATSNCNFNTMNILFEHYEKTNQCVNSEDKYSATLKQYKLRSILSEVLENGYCPDEMDSYIRKYLKIEDDTSSEDSNYYQKRLNEFDDLNVSSPPQMEINKQTTS